MGLHRRLRDSNTCARESVGRHLKLRTPRTNTVGLRLEIPLKRKWLYEESDFTVSLLGVSLCWGSLSWGALSLCGASFFRESFFHGVSLS